MKTHLLAALLLVSVLAVPSTQAAPQTIVEDFEDDVVDAEPTGLWLTSSSSTVGANDGDAWASVKNGCGVSSSKCYQVKDGNAVGELGYGRFNLAVDVCSLSSLQVVAYANDVGSNGGSAFGFFENFHTAAGMLGNSPSGGQYRGFGITWSMFDNILRYQTEVDGVGADDGADYSATLATTTIWGTANRLTFQFSEINCAAASLRLVIPELSYNVVHDSPGSWPSLGKMDISRAAGQGGGTNPRAYISVDNMTFGGADVPFQAFTSVEYATEVDDLQFTNDGEGYAFMLQRDSTVHKFTGNLPTLDQITSVNVCNPAVTGYSVATGDPDQITQFSVSPTDKVFVICDGVSADTIIGYPDTLAAPFTTRTDGVQGNPSQVAGSQTDSDSLLGVIYGSSDQKTVYTLETNGLIDGGSSTLCSGASVMDVAVDRAAELSSTLWTVNDNCGVEGYPSDFIGAATTTSSAVGNSIAAHGDFVYVSDSSANTLKKFVTGGGTLTQSLSEPFDYGNIRVSWDGRYIIGTRAQTVWLVNVTDLQILADYSLNAGYTANSCDIDASNNYIWCGGERSGGGGFIQTFEAYNFTVSEAGGQTPGAPNPTIAAGQFTPGGTVGTPTTGTGIGAGNPGTVTPNEPQSLVGVNPSDVGVSVGMDGTLFSLLVALGVMAGLAAAGAAAGSAYGVALWGGVGGGIVGLIGTTAMGWMPIWVVIFIFTIGAAIVVFQWRAGSSG